MNYSELNAYIKHYIEKDKTGRAIMLTGPWGIGKSFYIKNELIPFLEKEENKKHQCIVVSLYGLSDTAEISKAIFFEAKLKLVNPKTSGGKTVQLIAKTLFKGVTSYFGVDLNADEEDLQSLYSSIDLSGKLIVLEDVERSQIDILTLLGYVNNLVEQDGVKVLLVTNEDEIIKTEPSVDDKKEEEPFGLLGKEQSEAPQKKYTENTLCYLAVKEKTVSDTICFEGDLKVAVRQIICLSDCEKLKQYGDDDSAKDVVEIMLMSRSQNLRSIMFACQKTADIFEVMKDGPEYSEDFFRAVFYGIVFFSMGIHAGVNLNWIGAEHLSTTLGSDQFPLFRFCFDYITAQRLNREAIESDYKAFNKYKLYDKSSAYSDEDLRVLNNYDTSTEKEVMTALANVEKRLKEKNDISYSDYGRLAILLIGLKNDLEVDIEPIKELLVDNLRGKGENLRDELFWSIPKRFSKDSAEELNQLMDSMMISLKDQILEIPGFDYQPEQVGLFRDYVSDKRGFILESGRFATRIDIQRFIEMFKHCSAEQILKVREVFNSIYLSIGNIREYLSNDLPVILQFKQEVNKIINYKGFDRIQSLQCRWFAEELARIVNVLQ